ncbi:MAG: 3-ketoacyl-ACP reductase [Anaerolineae bacterium]|nr:3-ketoacyl-ACP reductase [Anaerolineae bacterium]
MKMKKVALITGAGRGIGLGIALALAQDAAAPCDIVVMDIHPDDVVGNALNELRNVGAEVLYCRADVTDAKARARVLDEIKARFGRLNVLVNNAGVAPKVRADILEATEESYNWVMDINLKGPYFLTQAAARWMIAQQEAHAGFKGCIVNISSTSATVVSVSRGEYCISKAGVSMATQLWAARLGEYDIPVYEIRPGIIKTPMTETVQTKYDKLIAEGITVQARWGYPDDIGKAVAALARGDFPYSTGQVIVVDGGLTLQRL